ncbi:MAG: type II secretion system GspH family protein [Firmicutes bacterium]|nr:type II secretion system GspH family protein [Bacillota bacterium]
MKKKGFTLIELMIVIAILAAILVPNFLRARAQGQYTQCQSNCKNIGTALEMYSTDNSGHYPTTGMSQLEGNYLKNIPTCASAGTSTVYTSSYSATTVPDSYTFYCAGTNHSAVGVGAGFPSIHLYPASYPNNLVCKGLSGPEKTGQPIIKNILQFTQNAAL